MREHVFTITISSTYMIRCGFFAIPLCCFMFSLISLWRTQSLVITTAQQIEQLKNELLAQEKVLSAPMESPVISKPSPFVKYITESLYGTRPRTQHNYFNTTINTPLEINTTTLLEQFGMNGTLTNVIIFDCYNGHFNISHNMKTLTYKPNRWYKGFDTFKYQLEVLIEDGTSKTVEGSAKIRVNIGVVLNKALLTPPTVYTFSETDQQHSAAIKEYLDNLNTHPVVPTHDTWLNRRYNTCAVVGNGGSLRGSKRGQEIDSHDIVVRINVSPLKGYHADVGSRMNISVAGGPASASCWLRSEAINSTYEVLSQASFRQHWGKMLTCPKEHTDINYLPMNYLFVDLVDRILEEYHIMMFNGTTKKYRSTGMMAVTAMTMICDHVSLYGFERGPKMENNYFEGPTTREWSGHSYQAEKAYYRDLVKGTGLFEPFLELYDLYTSFSYIVD